MLPHHPPRSRPALTRLRGGAKPALPVVSAPRSGLVASSPPATKALRGGGAAGGLDIPLLLTFAGWYLGNYYYTINNKFALNAAKQFPMTVAFAQVRERPRPAVGRLFPPPIPTRRAVGLPLRADSARASSPQFLLGSLYALYLWLAPDARERPNISASDVAKIAPVAACAAGAHCASIFSMNLGAVSFAQIVKARRPSARWT
jgi:solute carrier family 35 protein E1